MQSKIILAGLMITALLGCNNLSLGQEIEKVNADLVLSNIANYKNSKIEIHGYIVHVCGVDGKKMKLKTENGEIIKLVSNDSTLKFDSQYHRKNVCVQGKINETRIEKQTIDNFEKEKTLLCHIDKTPCKDKKWVENQIKNGSSDSLSQKDIKALKEKMQKTGKNYVSIFTLVAEKISIIDEEKKRL